MVYIRLKCRSSCPKDKGTSYADTVIWSQKYEIVVCNRCHGEIRRMRK